MAVTLLALFRAPGGDDDALETFIGRYQAEHVPLIAHVPGLRSQHVQRVTQTYTDSDLVMANHMTFDDRAAVETGHGQRRRCASPDATCARSRPAC